MIPLGPHNVQSLTKDHVAIFLLYLVVLLGLEKWKLVDLWD